MYLSISIIFLTLSDSLYCCNSIKQSFAFFMIIIPSHFFLSSVSLCAICCSAKSLLQRPMSSKSLMNNWKCFIPELQKSARNNYKQTSSEVSHINPIPALYNLFFRQRRKQRDLGCQLLQWKGDRCFVFHRFFFCLLCSFWQLGLFTTIRSTVSQACNFTRYS